MEPDLCGYSPSLRFPRSSMLLSTRKFLPIPSICPTNSLLSRWLMQCFSTARCPAPNGLPTRDVGHVKSRCVIGLQLGRLSMVLLGPRGGESRRAWSSEPQNADILLLANLVVPGVPRFLRTNALVHPPVQSAHFDDVDARSEVLWRSHLYRIAFRIYW